MGKIKSVNKIIYFDKETIHNILEEQNRGAKFTSKNYSSSMKVESEVVAEAKLKLSVPFIDRVSFFLLENYLQVH